MAHVINKTREESADITIL